MHELLHCSVTNNMSPSSLKVTEHIFPEHYEAPCDLDLRPSTFRHYNRQVPTTLLRYQFNRPILGKFIVLYLGYRRRDQADREMRCGTLLV